MAAKQTKTKPSGLKKQNKFKWCIDHLLIGYIVQTLLLLVIVCSGDISKMDWLIFMLIPYGIWGIEMARVNLR